MANFVLQFSFFVSIFLIQSISAQISTTTTAQPESLDPTVGGKSGNPGAQIRFSTKALDSIYTHALEKISQSIKSMAIPDVVLPVGGGMLTIKSVRVTEAKFADFERQLSPPNKIRSALIGGKITSVGQWQYKAYGQQRAIKEGVFRTMVSNAEVNMTNQLSRTWDAKPTVTTQDCKAYLGQFRVEIEGFGDNATVIDSCDNMLCQRIRSFFEDSVCNTARNYVRTVINQKLSTFPTRVNLGNTGNRFVMDYGLLQGEPKVTEEFIQAYLEGDVLSRGSGSAPFYAVDLCPIPMTNDRQSMISFPLSDFAFNTLLFQAHNQQYRFSAIDHLPSTSPLKDSLRLNCTSPVDCRRSKSLRCTRLSVGNCLGSLLENSTNQFSSDDWGDLVFKSQKPLQVLVRQQSKSFFGVNSGSLEVYGPAKGSDGKRDMLAKVDILSLRGDFVPKMNASNITGQVNITDLQLTQSPQSRHRSITDQMISKFQQLSMPILTEMFNAFLSEYAQFPVPLVEGYECDKPEFQFGQRTMQIDCDVRVLADATKVKRP